MTNPTGRWRSFGFGVSSVWCVSQRAALRLVIVLFLFAPVGATPAAAQDTPAPDPAPVDPTAEFFDDQAPVRDLRLWVHSLDWAKLQESFQENTYYPADLEWQGQTVRNIGIRSRGGGSRDRNKPGLRVDFNRYTTGQEFLGLKSIVLDNARQDASFIKERLSMKLFKRMGLPAPREAPVRLFVNNDYIGLYIVIESIDKNFLRATFGADAQGKVENDGYLFQFEYAGEWHFEPLDFHYWEGFFDPVTHENEPAATLYGPIEAMVNTVNQTPDGQFVEAASEYLDLTLFLRTMAVEMYLAENDGFFGYAGMNNFYVYRFEGRNLSQIIAWDKDNTFFDINFSVFTRTDDNYLMRRLLRNPAMRAIYHDALRAVVASAEERPEGEPDGNPWLAREIERQVGQIREAVYQDTRKAFSNERFEEEATYLIDFARRRGALVLSELRD
jgi:spore coat protein CotH